MIWGIGRVVEGPNHDDQLHSYIAHPRRSQAQRSQCATQTWQARIFCNRRKQVVMAARNDRLNNSNRLLLIERRAECVYRSGCLICMGLQQHMRSIDPVQLRMRLRF